MIRREFLKRSGILSAAALAAGKGILAPCTASDEYRELAKHTIDRVEFGEVDFSWPRFVGKNARIGVHGQHHQLFIAKLFTDQGASGWGLVPGGRGEDQKGLAEKITGKTVYQLFRPSSGILADEYRPFDFALHDLAGIILDRAVYQMMGSKGPRAAPVYSGMIYFDELEPGDNPAGVDRVMENCRWDYAYGYRQLKVKIGRSGRWYPHDEGLAMDIRITRMIHEEFGDKIDILVDANDMYTLQDTIDFLKAVEGVPLYWVEEPFVETYEKGRRLKEWMMANGREGTCYADGERNPDVDVCMTLGRDGFMDVYLADIVGLGFTAWRNLMPSLIDMGMLSSPHGWGTRVKTNYLAHLSAGMGNVCTIEGVTCTSDDIDFGNYPLEDGKIIVSGDPGFGMKLI